ncbi:MAG TPA: MCE family protein [Mycobacteriales bacterium]|nr:MCE family protein [Mycobacteriales bacterium]
MTRRLALLGAALGLVASTACNGLLGSNLPGGSAKGPTYRVTAVFDDVLDLVPQAAVKVDDVSVGDVEKISLDPVTFKARVQLRLKQTAHLPRNATARLRQTSLLGEKFVALEQPDDEAPSGELRDGDTIEGSRTARTPEVEEVFTAMSALLNGGGIGNLQTISVELSAALSGREATVRSAFRNVTALVGALDQRKADIVRAIEAMDRLTSTLAKQRQTIGEALDTFTPALTVLADQRADLTRLLQHLARLGQVGTRVVEASRADTVRSLQLLAPILDKVVAARGDLAKALDQVLLLTKLLPRAIPGDYLQLYVEIFLDPSKLPPGALPKAVANAAKAKGAKPATAARTPAAPAAPPLPDAGAGLDWLMGRVVR